MLKAIWTVLAAVSVSFLSMLSAPASLGADLTKVTCIAPRSEVATGQDIGDLAPRFTVVCTGGSSAGNITYFAFRLGQPDRCPVASDAAQPQHEINHDLI